jgi:hypothetical protein
MSYYNYGQGYPYPYNYPMQYPTPYNYSNQYPYNRQANGIENFFGNPAVQSTLLTGAGGALGGGLGGPWGGAIGAGTVPIVQSLLSPQHEQLGQVLTQAGLAAAGGGIGTALIKGPVGGGLGGVAGGFLGYELAHHHF